MAHDLFRLRLEFKGNISGSVLPFQTKSALNRWSLLNFMLTLNGTDLGEEYDTKVVYNYDTFPVSIYNPYPTNGPGVMIFGSQGCCWKFQFSGQIVVAGRFGV
jgi:hypothetical protein